MNIQQPPEGILDPQQPYWPADKVGQATWLRLKGKLTGRKIPELSGEQHTSYVRLGDADADRLIENLKKWGKYPQVNQNDKYGGAYAAEAFQKWLVEEFLEKPFREQVDQKIEDRQAARAIADILNRKSVKQAVELTTDVIEDPWGEGTVPAKQYAVVPTTKLLPPAKEVAEQQQPEAKKRGSSLVKSMTKTFARMETHFQKLTEISATSEGNVSGITDAFRIQSDALVKGFQDTTALVNKVASAVDLQATTMVRIAKGKKDLDQKALDAQQLPNEEIQMEQQSASSGNAQVKGGDGPGSAPGGGGIGGAIGKVLGGSALANFVAGKGLKKIAGKVSSKVGKKVTEVALRRALGKDAAEGIAKTIGREACRGAGVEKGIGKAIGKKVPLIGLGLGAFFAAERAAKGDMLGAALELTSGAASTFPGIGTGASLAIDAALIGRDAGVVPFEKGGLTQKSTFSGKRPGVTDLSPGLFKKMYQYELDYEQKNKNKFGKIYADGYEKYFAKPALPNILQRLLGGVIDFFKNLASRLGNFVRGLTDPLANLFNGPIQQYESTGGQKIKRSEFGRGFGVRDNLGSGRSATGHTGLDVGMPSGTPLSIVPPGVVHFTATGYNGGYGNLVVIKLDDGRFVKLNHLSQINVKVGDRVGEGSGENGAIKVVGKVGSTGLSTGPHMHIDVGSGFDKNTYYTLGIVDPSAFVLGGGVVKGGNVRAAEKKDPPTPKTADTRQTYASQQITQNFGVKEGKRVYFPYNGETNFYHGYKTRTGWDIYAGKAKLDTSSEKNAGVVKAFLDYATNHLVYNKEELSPPDPHGVELNAAGGPVRANTPIIVGDAGPEMFVPKQDGFVINNQQTAGLVDFIDKMIFGGPTGKPVRYPSSGPRDAIESIGGKYHAPYGPDPSFKPVRGAMLENQTNKLVAMAPLEEQMSNSVMIIRVNNTAPPVVLPSSDDGFEQTSNPDVFGQLHLAAIS